MKNKISSVGCRKWLFAGYIHVVLGDKSLKRNNKKLFPFFCCFLVNNKEIIKGTSFPETHVIPELSTSSRSREGNEVLDS